MDRRADDHQRASTSSTRHRPRAGRHEEGRASRCGICEDISKGVAAGIGAGRSLPEIQKTLTLDAYKGFERWDTPIEPSPSPGRAVLKGDAVGRYNANELGLCKTWD